MKNLSEKKAEALQAIAGGLGDGADPVVIFRGGLAGVVLLHLVRKTMGAEAPVRVIFFPGPDAPFQIFNFADKLRRLWGLDMSVYRRAGEAVGAVKRLKYKRFFSAETDDSSLDEKVLGCGRLNPFSSFSYDEIKEMAIEYRVPVCTLHGVSLRSEAAAEAAPGGKAREDEAIVRTLKALGYM